MKKTIFSVLAVIFLAIAVYYWVTKAGSLPHWLPGYQAGSTHVHFKHGIAAFILAVGSGLLVWFSGGSKKDGSTSTKSTPTD